MRLWMYFAFLSALLTPIYGAKKEIVAPPTQVPAGVFTAYQPGLNKAPGDIETNLDRPEYNLDRAFEGASPNARIDLYSGALQIQEQDLFLPGSYGVNLEINRDFNGKVYVPRADTLRVRAPDSWVGVGWRMNWGVLTPGDTVVVFDLAGYPAQRMYLATTGDGTDPAGNATHDYRFLSPITGDLVQPYLSKDFWRAWTEPSQIEGDPIWYVQDTDGKLFQIEKVDHVVGDYAATRIWHPMSPDTDITIEYESTQVRLNQRPNPESANQVLVNLSNGKLASIRVADRRLDYQVSRCGGNPQDPEERNCLVRFTNAEGEATEYDYGTQAGNWAAELDKITTAMGAVYTYRYDDETYYHYRSESGLFNTRVVRRWQRGEQAWDYDYDHPQVERYDEDLDFYVSDKTHVLTTVEGPENVRRQYLFATYAGAVGDGLRLTTYAQDAGRLFSSAEFHKEVWNLNEITGAQYRMVDGLTEAGKSPAIYFTHVVNPEDNHIPFIALAAYKYSGFLPHDEILDGNSGDRPNPFILQDTRYKFRTRGETEPEKGPTLVWIEDLFGRPEEVVSTHLNRNAPDEKHITRNELTYGVTAGQLTHNQVFLVTEDVIFHNGPAEDDGVIVPAKANEATTPASRVVRVFDEFGEPIRVTTYDLVTDHRHQVVTTPRYHQFQVTIQEAGRDEMRVIYRSGLPAQIQILQAGAWLTLRSAEYDSFGNMIGWTNSLNQTSTFEYDRLNRIRFEHYPLMTPSETRYTIGQGAVVRRQIGESGPWEELTFDVFGRKVDHRKSEIADAQFVYQYDALDRLVGVTHPNGGVESRQYDALGRLVALSRTRDDRVERQRWQYWDSLSLLYTDAMGNQSFKRDDGTGAPSMFVDQTGAVTDIHTDAFGRILRVEHGTAVRLRKYSGLGRMREEYHPETGLQKFEYNSTGDLIIERFYKDQNEGTNPHKIHRFEYDGRGRITRQFLESTDVNTPSIHWVYDQENLVSVHNETADLTFDYDDANRLEARHFNLRQANQILTTRYGYTNEGHLEWMEYPSGSRVTQSFDANRHLSGASVATAFGVTSMVEDLQYVPGLGQSPNPVAGAWKLGNNLEEVRYFGVYGRSYAEELHQSWTGGQRLVRKERTFDVLGRITQHESYSGDGGNPSQIADYQYDTLSRLVRADYRDQDHGLSRFEDFYFDADNNLLAYGGNADDMPMQYPVSADFNGDGSISQADLHGFSFGDIGKDEVDYTRDLDGDGKVTLFDAAKQGLNVAPFATPDTPITNRLVGWEFTSDGNVSRTPDGMRYSYNTWNQLVAFGENERLAYDPENHRILEWQEGETSKKFTLFSEAGNPIAEYRLEGTSLTLTKEAYYFGGKPVAADIYEPEDPDCSERVWIHSDYLGSPTDYTDDSGSVAGYQAFSAFGQKWTADMACVPIERGFTGHQSLADSNLTWMKARSYSNRYGRFLQPDPVTITRERLADPGQLNLYTYVRNSPTLGTDPTGKIPLVIPAGIFLWRAFNLYDTLKTIHDDYQSVKRGERTFKELIQEKGTEYLGGLVFGKAGKYGGRIGKKVFRTVEDKVNKKTVGDLLERAQKVVRESSCDAPVGTGVR